MEKNIVLQEIVDFYLQSNDFNGLPIYQMNNYSKEELLNLIDNDLVEAISEKEVLNPHIRGFNLNISKNVQKNNATDIKSHTCFYPTEKALEGVKIDYETPYTSLMQKGKKQFDIIFFDIEILERYINNPKFLIIDNGYRGSICIRDEYYDDEDNNSEYIKDYGMAYIEGAELKRAVAVFLIDLANLSPKIQMLWKAFELRNQKTCNVDSGFKKNLIYGEWVTDYWIFHAIIDEMIIINKQCKAMDIPPLFSHTYSTNSYEMPEGYRNILLPTMKNYYDFVLVLEKMFVHNISIKAFKKDGVLIKGIERKDNDGHDKGSLVMLEEWMNKNIKTNIEIKEVIIKPLKNIRKIRQVPAHEITNNKYDIGVYKKQNDLIIETYKAIRGIRLLFSNLPQANTIEIPEQLITGNNIVCY
ncbi:AAA family ATPase [Clostridium felsineum]|uniref:AAA family ATPase n=1 Tax=Clostridium felsineum TaxID=36839 RepID=UPI00214DBB2F|nr:AAA family ATPase [Clostridium felsineum]MCR3758140.1 AAA family ATPase [Clostridium felsineum]